MMHKAYMDIYPVTTAIDIQKQYWFKREYEENLSKLTLIITEYVEG